MFGIGILRDGESCDMSDTLDRIDSLCSKVEQMKIFDLFSKLSVRGKG
jgi:hypothetical protein